MPFSYMAAYLLADLDYVLRQAYTLKRLGIYLDASYGASIFVSKLRDVFIQPRKWRHTGVTRQAILDNNQVAQQAREVMGEVPAQILNQEIQSGFLLRTAKLTDSEKRSITLV